ncbi:MAG: methionine adenosyltransferase [Candidatus Anoxymicrobium japonicum]|uniref:S-adenosylmethionine synthase n=1 Tax=Candidatus Anoxymicrobium japonicum TaxID=2013648 RepID=A0A2N3G666_9ACTN|nr:MAG: methionine adenosyltransferase [Candidatus Anoxymicrobium japonicum]
MAQETKLFTSESVTEGHPDKVADLISDAILDEIIGLDPKAHVACETMVTTGLVILSGEISTDAYVDIRKVVKQTISEIGYTRPELGFDFETCGMMISIDEQSADIKQGVDSSLEAREGTASDEVLDAQGAGDQGMMFGFACTETEELMPVPIILAHKLARRLTDVRKAGVVPYLRPDGKTQVTVEYDGYKPVGISTVVIAAQHDEGVDIVGRMLPDLSEHVLKPIIPEEWMAKKPRFLVNPTGSFVIGGPMGDTGVTGRKIIVDTYGGMARHGGGCFSGKDPSKVDRSASYAARYVAKNVVAAGLAERFEIQIAYVIGKAHPVSISCEAYGTEKIPIDRIEKLIRKHFDLRPAAIIRDLELLNPIYKSTAAYGHFGRNEEGFTWERTDKADMLKQEAGL